MLRQLDQGQTHCPCADWWPSSGDRLLRTEVGPGLAAEGSLLLLLMMMMHSPPLWRWRIILR